MLKILIPVISLIFSLNLMAQQNQSESIAIDWGSTKISSELKSLVLSQLMTQCKYQISLYSDIKLTESSSTILRLEQDLVHTSYKLTLAMNFKNLADFNSDFIEIEVDDIKNKNEVVKTSVLSFRSISGADGDSVCNDQLQ